MLETEYLSYDESSPSCVRWIKDYDLSTASRFPKRVGDVFGTITGKGYFRASFNGKPWYVHRMVWLLCNGCIDDNLQIDHIDGDRQNNKISNLRLVTAFVNQSNMHTKNSTSSRKGIAISKNGKSIAYYGRAKGQRFWSQQFKIADFESLDEAINELCRLRSLHISKLLNI